MVSGSPDSLSMVLRRVDQRGRFVGRGWRWPDLVGLGRPGRLRPVQRCRPSSEVVGSMMKMADARAIAQTLTSAKIAYTVNVFFIGSGSTDNRYTVHVPGPIRAAQVKTVIRAAGPWALSLSRDGGLVISDPA